MTEYGKELQKLTTITIHFGKSNFQNPYGITLKLRLY